MDKDDILRRMIPSSCHWEDNLCNTPKHYVYTAMDEYAQQQSIAFAEFIADEYPEYKYLGDGWLCNTGHFYSTQELYTLYLQQTKDK